MRFNIVSIRKTLVITCCLLLIGLLAGSVIAFGQSEPTPNSTETAAVVTTSGTETASPTAATPPPVVSTLIISASPTTVTVGTPTIVAFNVTSNGKAVSGATVTLSGSATGNGISNGVGLAMIYVNATASGTITATASLQNYTTGTTTLAATGTNASAFFVESIVFVLILIVIVLFVTKNIKTDMLISLLILFVSFGVWMVEVLLTKIDILGVLGAGVFGGVVLDIAVNKGKYILPTTEKDGIYLGVLYGGIVGFVIAITTISNHSDYLTVSDSLAVFVAATSLKGASEYMTSDTLIKKKKNANICFNLAPTEKVEKGFKPSDPKEELEVGGEIVIKEDIERQVVHLNLKSKDNKLIIRDILTDEKETKKFSGKVEVKGLLPGNWEAWITWDSDEFQAESIHQPFTVIEDKTTSPTPTPTSTNPSQPNNQ